VLFYRKHTMNAIIKKIADDGRVILHGRPTGRRKGGNLPPEQVRRNTTVRMRTADRDVFIEYGGNLAAGVERAAELARKALAAEFRERGTREGEDGGAA
jgi:hypothetical protein